MDSSAISRLKRFVIDECIPAEFEYQEYLGKKQLDKRFLTQPPVIERLKLRAKELGVWNLFALSSQFYEGNTHLFEQLVPPTNQLRPSSTVEYAKCCEIIGMSPKIAPEVTNTNAPDTGNMELLARFGNRRQNERYLLPLIRGETRSAFAMTEPGVASSDAVNIKTSIVRRGSKYILNGRKWWISNGGHPNLDFLLVFALSADPSNTVPHRRHSIVIVPKNANGVTFERAMNVFGYDDAVEGHFEVVFDNVELDIADSLVHQEGSGFEIIQARLGPGRIHHCMRAIGMAERVLQMVTERVNTRKVFGRLMKDFSDIQHRFALHRIELEKCRHLLYHTASLIDKAGPKQARIQIAMIKVSVPTMLCRLIDDAIQIYGAAGLSQDTPLAQFFSLARALRLADGPDAVHLMQIGKYEFVTSRL